MQARKAAGLLVYLYLMALGVSPVDTSSYFPERLDCTGHQFKGNPIPSEVMEHAASKSPTPLFSDSFEQVSRAIFNSRWLPERFDDARYLEMGEGAYRAQVAHLFKVYDVSGSTVTLKKFVDSVSMIVQPLPEDLAAVLAHSELAKAREHTDPCKEVYPYPHPYENKPEGVPRAVQTMFNSFFRELLTEDAQPFLLDTGVQYLHAYMKGGGLQSSHLTRERISDPGTGSHHGAEPTILIWTDGDTLKVRAHFDFTLIPGQGELYQHLQPTDSMSTSDLALPYLIGATFKGEWVDSDEYLVPTAQQASKQRIYLDVGYPVEYLAFVPAPLQTKHIELAAWLSLANSNLMKVVSYHYSSRHVKRSLPPSDLLEVLEKQYGAYRDALRELRDSPCPQEMLSVRESILSVVRPSERMWEVAWEAWEPALTNPEADNEAIGRAIDEEFVSQELPLQWSWGDLWPILEEAQKSAEVKVGEAGCGG